MERFRKAALSLHAMQASDREWLLGQLPVAQRHRLASMLDELEDLGVPREPVLLGEVVSMVGREPMASKHPLAEADPAALQAVLEHEPDAVAIALLGGTAWPWSRQLLDGFRSTGRDAIEAALASGPEPLPDKAFEALCDATLDAIEQLPGNDFSNLSHAAPARRWRLLEKLKWPR